MNSKQLELLITYISNEIQIQALRGSGMTWQVQSDVRENITQELRKSVAEVNLIQAKPDTNKIKSPHGGKNQLSPLMVDMLMFAYHNGHNFSQFPNLRFLAQQQAYNFFLVHEYFYLRDFKPTVALTEKGQDLVQRILNPGL